MPEMMGIAAYAKHRNVTENALREAMASGRLKNSVHHKNGRRVIDQVEADKEWEQNKLTPSENDSIDSDDKTTLLDARKSQTLIKAHLLQIELKKQMGELVEIEKVKSDAFKCARTVRDALRQIPAKISAEIAAETDPHRVELMLQKEIDEALTELSRISFD